MNELEGNTQALVASPERLLALASNISSSSVDAPRVLHKDLAKKLHSIAATHGGEVPLHGRLFAQWLHYAFPNECPFPHVSENTAALTPSHWLGKKTTAPLEERKQHIEAMDGTELTSESPFAQWSEHEVLPLHEPKKPGQSIFRSAMRIMVQIAMCFVLLR